MSDEPMTATEVRRQKIADETDNCRMCKGTGKQAFHGSFESYFGACNFCGGHGTREEERKFYDKAFKERGITGRKFIVNQGKHHD